MLDPQQATIPSRFLRQLSETPMSVAVKVGGRCVTYAELRGIVARIAGTLNPQERSERPVAILMEEGPSLVAAMLAVLSVGRPFVPLEVRLPEARIAAVLSASGASHIITDSACRKIARMGMIVS